MVTVMTSISLIVIHDTSTDLQQHGRYTWLNPDLVSMVVIHGAISTSISLIVMHVTITDLYRSARLFSMVQGLTINSMTVNVIIVVINVATTDFYYSGCHPW